MNAQTDIQANLYMSIRERVCVSLCPGGRKCMNLKCISAIFQIVGEIETELEAEREHSY